MATRDPRAQSDRYQAEIAKLRDDVDMTRDELLYVVETLREMNGLLER